MRRAPADDKLALVTTATPAIHTPQVLLETRELTKAYPGAQALAGVSLTLRAGEVRGLIGPNGAGKTTLVSIVAGMERPDSGEVWIAGERLQEFTPLAAASRGVAVVPQHPDLFPSLSVLDNLFVGTWPRRWGVLDWGEMRRRAREVMERLGAGVPLGATVGSLSLADRQMVQIARALLHEATLFIFDEPTTPLTSGETERLFATIRDLSAAGHAVVYITHRLPELFGLTERITLLRDGRLVGTMDTAETSEEELVRRMAGEARAVEVAEARDAGHTILAARELRALGATEPVSFDLRRGEVLGLTGLAVSGADLLARALAGAVPAEGEMLVEGVRCEPGSVRAAQKAGVYLLPSDRHGESLLLGMSVRENVTVTALRQLCSGGGWIDTARERAVAEDYTRRLAIRLASIEQPVDTLSGGNQQKVALAKLLAAEPRVLVSIEPTQGVDVAARAEIHRLLRELSAQGMGVIVVAGEAAELQRLCDRVLVMHRGRLVAELSRAEADEETILRHAGGVSDEREEPAQRGERGPARRPGPAWPRELNLALFLVALAIVVGSLNPEFLSPGNLRDVASNASHVLVAALAMTAVIITGNIDISVGSGLGLCAAVGAGLAVSGWPLAAVMAATVAVGCLLGLLNSAAVVGLRLPSIIVTLGTLNVFRGLLIHTTGGRWITGLPQSFRVIALGRIAGVPVGVVIAVAAAVAMALVLRFTAWGRCVYLWGDNPRSAQRLGLRGSVIVTSVLALMGCALALAAMMFAARFSAVQSNAGLGFEMLVITCAVVGGANIFGGRGTVIGTVLGVLLVTVLGNALTLLQLSAYWDKAAQGALVLAAVSADVLGRRRRQP